MLTSLACWLAVSCTALADVSARLEPGQNASAQVDAPASDRNLSVLISIDDPGRLPAGVALTATVELGSDVVLRKSLHLGDPDVVWSVRQPANTAGTVTVHAPGELRAAVPCVIQVKALGEPADDGVAFEVEPNDTPEAANRVRLGQTVYGFADDRAYLPLGEQPTEVEQASGKDWFRFQLDSDTPQLAFFALDFVDRDVPPDVRIYQLRDGKPVEYTTGIDPQSQQRERPPRPGANKFTTRVLTRGTYYILVDACQPDYQLRTRLYPVPPYLGREQSEDAEAVAEASRKAVRTSMDFQLLAGDSWHANTPRKGHPLDRVANFHHETSTCIACHPTHFTTQSVLTAVRQGYKVEQPFALRFLTDRLYNNPVPFHGHPEALWARVIPAPANVMGRLSLITMDYEDLVTGQPRNALHRGVAEFLKLYYDGRTSLPPDESNGNNPVSRYKVATESWQQLDRLFRRTGDERFAQTRDFIASVLATGEPANMRALAQQTIGLCLAGRERFHDQIQANVERMLKLQLPDGSWAIQLDLKDPKAKPSQMQTGECLYALSLAGLPADHPAMLKGTAAVLLAQKPFGGWLDTNPYEQFSTPFRETQWSLMALSKLYPGPGTKGWNGPLGPQPSALRVEPAARVIQDLERVWDDPGLELQTQIIALLDHELPVVRLSACLALSRAGTPDAIEPLARRLGDESKAVRRAAAEALRALGNRVCAAHPPGETSEQRQATEALAAALRSPDSRTRRGATRVFAAHFRELSQELPLAGALLLRLDDPDPVVQMQAIKGLWRWWYWRADESLRNRVEDALIERLAQPTHPWVRRNLIEALYILGDENIRYLYTNWVPSLATSERRAQATAAQHATANRLARKYVAVLQGSDNSRQREGVLRALSEFFERPVLGGRIGNDLEPMLVYDDALPAVTSALIGQMSDPDPTIRRLALQALVAVRGHREPSLARAILGRRGDADPSVREWAETMSAQFPLNLKAGQADPALLAVVDELLASPVPEAQAAALGVLARVGPAAGPDRSDALRRCLGAEAPRVRAAALSALHAFAPLLRDAGIRQAVDRGLADDDPAARVAAIGLVLDQPAVASASERSLRRALEDEAPAHRLALLGLIQTRKAREPDLRLVGVISNALVDDNSGVREKALQVIQGRSELVANPAIEDSLRTLTRSDNARQKEIAQALLKSRGRLSSGDDNADLLDLAYFEAKILPIFNTPGEDGQSCMGCHRSHTILKMTPPGKDGRWSSQAARANFRAALRVVNLPNPAGSLLVNKPTWEAAEEAEAQTDPTKHAHAGGVRFEKGSPEYQTLLDWINGARLDGKGEHASAR